MKHLALLLKAHERRVENPDESWKDTYMAIPELHPVYPRLSSFTHAVNTCKSVGEYPGESPFEQYSRIKAYAENKGIKCVDAIKELYPTWDKKLYPGIMAHLARKNKIISGRTPLECQSEPIQECADCGRQARMYWFKGKYICRRCLNPPYEPTYDPPRQGILYDIQRKKLAR